MKLRCAIALSLLLMGLESQAGPKGTSLDSTVTEVKVAVADGQIPKLKKALKIKSHPTRQRIFYLDTARHELYEKGIIIRARQTGHGKFQIVVKLRPLDPSNLSEFSDFPEMDYHFDLTTKAKTFAGALKSQMSPGLFEQIVEDGKHRSRFFSSEQKDFLHRRLGNAASEPLKLEVLGPITAKVWYSNSWKVEEWNMPDGRNLVEVSEKVPTKKEEDALAEINGILKSHHIRRARASLKTAAALNKLSRLHCIRQTITLK